MAKKSRKFQIRSKSKSQFDRLIKIALLFVLSIVILALAYKAFSDSTEIRSKAAANCSICSSYLPKNIPGYNSCMSSCQNSGPEAPITSPCTPGATKCNGSAWLDICTPQGNWTAQVDCSALIGSKQCVNGNCVPVPTPTPSCSPGAKKCYGSGYEVCSAKGYWSAVMQCNSTSSCSNGSCVPLPTTCTPGATKCNGNGTAWLYICAQGGYWTADIDCLDAENEECVNGSCVPFPTPTPSCSPGAKKCYGSGYEVCSAKGYWSAVMQCNSTSSCSNGSCVPLPTACTPGATKCNGSAWLDICTPQGNWTAQVDCSALIGSKQCVNGNCVP